ncbi:MAG: helix-turn-helix transcriptional regulator [Candidatus Odinarchaeia archaeon]
MASELEERALKVIREYEKEGIPQNELWKIINTTSREGYKVSTRLERKGLIKRIKELHNGRWTYRLFPIIKKPKPIKWSSLNDCPCLYCKDLTKCGVGHQISPLKCNKQNNWLKKCIDELESK